jgi:hypothetical protein
MTDDSLEQPIAPPQSGEYTGPSLLNYWIRPAIALVAPLVFFYIVTFFDERATAIFRAWQFLLMATALGVWLAAIGIAVSRSFACSVSWDESSLEVSWHTGPPQIIRWDEITKVRSAEVASRGLPLFLGTSGENTWAKTASGTKFTINSAYLHYEELKAALQARVAGISRDLIK